MALTIETPAKCFPRDKVDAAAAKLQAGDPDWAYTPRHCPKGTGYSVIDIFDEDGEFVATY